MKAATAAPPERKARCRMRNRLDDPCSNEVIDPDPGAPQICVRHAMEGARLLADAGAITFQFATPTTRKRPA